MNKKFWIILITVLLALPFTASAQEYVILEYFEDFDGDSEVYIDEEPFTFEDIGMGGEIPESSSIITGFDAYAELSMANGSIIKLSGDTAFTIDSLQYEGGGDENAFGVAYGKFRAIWGKATGDEEYTITGPSAVCGIRGTDMGMDISPGGKEDAFVLDGQIDYTNSAGETLNLGSGMMANAMDAVFAAVEIPPAYMAALMEDLGFSALDPAGVPGHTVSETEPAESAGPADEAVVVEEPPTEEEPTEEEAIAAAEDDGNALMESLKKILGMEIGAVTIGDKTYSKAVLQPVIPLGKLKLGLYLPIIYETDMFNPDDWYKPEGNNEWSFGTDKEYGDVWISRILDFGRDLVLKIKFIDYGKQRDPFYFKVGNIHGVSLGHGLIMRDYANDSEFPVIRKVGLNLGMEFTKIGFESVVNDLANPDIFGGRFFIRPFAPAFRLGFGISGVADINPFKEVLETIDPLENGDPVMMSYAADLDLPIIERDMLSIIAFSDVAAAVPLLRADIEGTDLTAGLQTQAIFDSEAAEGEKFNNYGAAAGLFGNLLMIKYRLEARYFQGAFKPAMFGIAYDRIRGENAMYVLDYLLNPTAPEYNTTVMGIYGEGGFDIPRIFSLDIGYMWPWSTEVDEAGNKQFVPGAQDELYLNAVLERGIIPKIDIGASFEYARTDLVTPLLREEDAKLVLIDENTVVKGELLYGVAPTMDLAFIYTATLARDDYGSIIYEDGTALINNAIAIETRLHF
jgi:hypothetical protein